MGFCPHGVSKKRKKRKTEQAQGEHLGDESGSQYMKARTEDNYCSAKPNKPADVGFENEFRDRTNDKSQERNQKASGGLTRWGAVETHKREGWSTTAESDLRISYNKLPLNRQ